MLWIKIACFYLKITVNELVEKIKKRSNKICGTKKVVFLPLNSFAIEYIIQVYFFNIFSVVFILFSFLILTKYN